MYSLPSTSKILEPFAPAMNRGRVHAAEGPDRRVDPARHVPTCLRERLNGFTSCPSCGECPILPFHTSVTINTYRPPLVKSQSAIVNSGVFLAKDAGCSILRVLCVSGGNSPPYSSQVRRIAFGDLTGLETRSACMNLMKWLRKNNKKLMAVVVIVLMVAFIGGSSFQYLFRGSGGAKDAVAYFGHNQKISHLDLQAADQEVEIVSALGGDSVARAQGMAGLLLSELVFRQSRQRRGAGHGPAGDPEEPLPDQRQAAQPDVQHARRAGPDVLDSPVQRGADGRNPRLERSRSASCSNSSSPRCSKAERMRR